MRTSMMRKFIGTFAGMGLVAYAALGAVSAHAQNCSVWLVESSRFMNVPFGAFMPDRTFVPGSDNPMTNINLIDFPNAVVYVQREELKGIEWALNYPNPHIKAVNTDPGGCMRTPACGYPPKTLDEVYGKVLAGKAMIVDGEYEVLPGVKIHPAFRAHTAGSQLLEVPTTIGKLVFGSDAYSDWEGIRDWMIANPQQTDTVAQFLAYEQCYKITGGYQNCVCAHDPLSYTDKYPLTKKSSVGINGGRLAEVALAPGERSRRP